MQAPAAVANQTFVGTDFALLQRIGLDNERDALVGARRFPDQAIKLLAQAILSLRPPFRRHSKRQIEHENGR